MHLTLERIKSDSMTTIGNLWLEDELGDKPRLIAFTLEDEYRTKKVMNETRIPDGVYRIKLRNEGGMAPRYNERFTTINHRGMLHLQDVPGFKYIYIHVGNNDDDTSGCILVGYAATIAAMRIMNSADAYRDLYTRVSQAAEEGALSIAIINRDIS